MIKFRAWDKQTKKMCIVKGWHEFNGGEVTIKRQQEFASYQVPADSVILMQSTGLFDRNGQEIFEGDVVKIRDSNEIGIVKRDPHEPRLFVDYNKGSKCKLWFMEPVTESFFTVIGNIYENPDLLEDL